MKAIMKTLGVCLVLCGALPAQSADLEVRLGLDEVNTLANALTLPSISTSKVVGYGWATCTVRATGTPDSIEIYRSGVGLRYRIRGDLRLSGWCIPDTTRGFTASGSLQMRNVGSDLRLDFGSATASVTYLGYTFRRTVAVPDVDLPVSPVALQTRDGHTADVGLIGQRMSVSGDTITVYGNTWVR